MSDLSLEKSHQYWFEYDDPTIYRVLMFMESVESWTLDGDPTLEAAIDRLSQELSDLSDINMSELGHEEMFIRLACNIKASRTLRLLQAIDMAHPGSASKVLMHAEENSYSSEDPAGVFLRRNIVFERLRLLSRVFSKDRFNLVLRALEGEE